MTEGRQDATIMVAYLAQKERTDEALLAATAKAGRVAERNRTYGSDELHRSRYCLHLGSRSIPRGNVEGKKAIMLGIENGYAIGKDLTNVERFRNRELFT